MTYHAGMGEIVFRLWTRTLRPHLLLSFLDVIKVVGERGMNVSERDGGNVGDNFAGDAKTTLLATGCSCPSRC